MVGLVWSSRLVVVLVKIGIISPVRGYKFKLRNLIISWNMQSRSVLYLVLYIIHGVSRRRHS